MENNSKLVTSEHLEKIYVSIREMVQFGESKNGILLGANVAILYNAASKALSFSCLLNSILSCLALLCIVISTGILFYSIMPKLRFTDRVNPLFFGSVVKMSTTEYTKICSEMTEEDLVRYLSEQIHANSVIATRKFQEFKTALQFALPSYVAFVVLFFLKR
jgi:hypothetical protein